MLPTSLAHYAYSPRFNDGAGYVSSVPKDRAKLPRAFATNRLHGFGWPVGPGISGEVLCSSWPRLQNLQLSHQLRPQAVRIAKKRAAHEPASLYVVSPDCADRAVVLYGVARPNLADVHLLDIEIHTCSLKPKPCTQGSGFAPVAKGLRWDGRVAQVGRCSTTAFSGPGISGEVVCFPYWWVLAPAECLCTRHKACAFCTALDFPELRLSIG